MGTHPIFESDFDCLTDMGNYFTTIFPSGRFKEPDCCESPLPKPVTGSKTPVMSKADTSDAYDPRSPSHNVSRTPLKAEEGKVDILSDPRSPLQELNRTPLAHKENEKKTKQVIEIIFAERQSKNL